MPRSFPNLACVTATALVLLASQASAQIGVPSKPPRPIPIGGQGGLPIYRTRTLLPPPIVHHRPGINVRPGGGSPIVGPGFVNNLVKPIVGPGPITSGGGGGVSVPSGTGGGFFVNPDNAVGVPASSGVPTWWSGRDNCFTGGSSISGSFTDDNFRLKFHLGGGGSTICRPSNNCCFFPLSWYRGWWWGNNNYSQVVYSGPWNGTDPFVTQGQTAQQAAAAQQPARELLPIEKGELAWRAGQISEATRWMREHLAKEPDDAEAMRYLSLLLIDDRKIDQAVAVMALAYEKAPRLAAQPMPRDVLPGGEIALRRRVNAVSNYANSVGTSSAWLTLVVLMQAEGRDDVAARMLDRARAAGLSPAIADEMALSLRN